MISSGAEGEGWWGVINKERERKKEKKKERESEWSFVGNYCRALEDEVLGKDSRARCGMFWLLQSAATGSGACREKGGGAGGGKVEQRGLQIVKGLSGLQWSTVSFPYAHKDSPGQLWLACKLTLLPFINL